MRKTLVIIRREFVQGVRTRGFVISTLLVPVVMSLFFVVPGLLLTLRTGEATRLAVLDLTGRLSGPLAESLARGGSFGGESRRPPRGLRDENFEARFRVERVEPAGRAPEQVREELNRRVLAGELDAYLVLPADLLEGGTAQLYARNTGDVFTHGVVEEKLNRAVVEERLRAADIDGERVRQLSSEVRLARTRVTKGGEQRDEGGGFIFPFLIGVFIFFAIMMYGQAILSAVVEEKTTRIAEVLFSSLRAFPLMLGKLVGVSLVALTQFLIWTLLFAAVAAYGAGALMAGGGAGINLPRVPAAALVYAPLFFLLGFYVYSTVYAVVGSIVTTEKEASQIVLPVSLLPLIAMYMAFPVIRSPGSSFSFWVSMVPFFSPVTMLVRIVTETPPFWQVALSLAVGVLTVFGMVWVAARIYRTGMLMYGKRPTLPEIWRWVREP
ncbi:MAG TPA: ABC transporter permease [Pyrinomonadaceae bacterium]|nr:ABC transporter permease [Pyrinomonadaceae bacterium]